MREFFINELRTLYSKTQLRQYETISAMPDAEFQFKALLDALERVCNAFAYIPEVAKKSIILERMLTDDDFIGFNAKIISKWFNQAKDKYFHESHHMEVNALSNEAKTFDELPHETKALVNKFLSDLLGEDGIKKVPEVTQAEIDSIKLEDLQAEHKGLDLAKWQTSREVAIMADKRIEYGRTQCDIHTGKPLPGALSFDEWVKLDNT